MAYRTIVDPAGHRWTAWDTRPSSATGGRHTVAPGYERGWLTFERAAPDGGGAEPRKLRLAPIPDGWAELPDDGLLGLMGRAALVRSGSARAMVGGAAAGAGAPRLAGEGPG